jgi:predicted ATPase
MVDDQVIRPEKPTSKEIAREFDDNNLIISEPSGLPRNRKIRFLTGAFSRMRLYRRFNVILSAPMRHSALLVSGSPRDNFELNSEGDNLSIVYYHLFNTHKFRAIKDDILGILNNVFPDFTDIKFPADLGQGLVLLGWCEKTFEPMFYPQQLSEGTLQFLCLLAVLYNPYPPSIVCIDEPEIGLHPEMIKIVAELLIQASERMQIVVATHSPTLVSALRPEDIVVVEAKDGSSQFNRPPKEELEVWLKDFTLGELWEMGQIGGKM